ncbi:MAG: hypothetical protein ACI92N_002950 [Pseudomonadales bacterium]|jgi:hypothetical protein
MTTAGRDKLKILLLGDYSSVQSNLASALKRLGHDVTLASDGDGYKGLDRDVDLSLKFSSNKFLRKLGNFFLLVGLGGLINYWRLREKRRSFEGYDVVQIVNPVVINSLGSLGNMLLIRFLHQKNKRIYLLAIGDDYYWVCSALKMKSNKSCFKRMKLSNCHRFLYSLKYVYGFFYKSLNDYAVRVSEKVIPGLLDYKIPYSWCEKCTEIVPLPIQEVDFIEAQVGRPEAPLVIMNSWQNGKEFRKGNDIFHAAMMKILEIYSDRIRYVIPENQPYAQYRKLLDEADVVFDQCFSLDRGMNALLAMARGKVVLTGWTNSTKNLYGEKYFEAAFDATDKYGMYRIIERLILEPNIIDKTSNLAKNLIRDQHAALKVAKCYLEIWGSVDKD